MSDDMEIIEQIEKQIGKELELWQFGNIVSAFGNGYSLDKVGQVKGLNLDDIEIKDISFLESLGGLTHLLLRRDQISDLTPLSALKNLTELSLGSNQITDLTPLR